MKSINSIIAAAILSCTFACDADDAGPQGDNAAEFLTAEVDDLRVTTIPTSEGASTELVDLESDVVVATLDWNNASSTLTLDIGDSVSSTDLESPPEVGDLNAILLAHWKKATTQDADSFQVDKGDDSTADHNSDKYYISCGPGNQAKVTVSSTSPFAGVSTFDCSARACKNKCGYDYGVLASDSVPTTTYQNTFQFEAKCSCYEWVPSGW